MIHADGHYSRYTEQVSWVCQSCREAQKTYIPRSFRPVRGSSVETLCHSCGKDLIVTISEVIR